MKRLIARHIPVNYQFLLLSLALLMAMGTLFRAVLFFLNIGLASGSTWQNILYSFFNRGLLFDSYISAYILAIPFVLASIPFLARRNSKYYLLAGSLIITVGGIAIIFVSAIDIGYFGYYNSRITSAVFTWIADFGIAAKVVLTEPDNLLLFLLFLLLTGSYAWLQHRIYKFATSQPDQNFNIPYRILFFTFGCFLLFSGVRGTFSLKATPLIYRDAFFSDDHFLDQLGFNPVYHLGYSYNDPQINYFNNQEDYLNSALGFLDRKRSGLDNPFAMHVDGKDEKRPNIILIFMESMSNAMLSRYHPGLNTTPFLDSLAEHGLIFDGFYSAGIHTHNAIFTTLYGLPAVMNNVPMNSLATRGQVFYGMPDILKEKGYLNSFYVTGSKEFDNMDRFLSLNGFDRIVGEKDYGAGSGYNLWGATDETMFTRVVEDCDSLSMLGQPFFCGILTISSHDGYVVPPAFEGKLNNTKYPEILYEYADLQLRDFFVHASQTAWFDSTIFILVGDHGQNFDPVYDMNLNYHTVPLILYSPSAIQPRVYTDPGLQQDIYPTLFGILDFSYLNNGLGIDLFRHKREYGYFTADNKLGVIDDSLFMIYRGKGNMSLYNFREKSIREELKDDPDRVTRMLKYGFSMIQSTDYLIRNKLTGNFPTLEERHEVSRYIAHAGGRIGGHDYTNSLEALDSSYRKGFRLFELDISRTSDSTFVAAHDWKKWQEMTGYSGPMPPSHEAFMQQKLFGQYSPLDMERINAWFTAHPDAILVTDKINEPGAFSAQFIDKKRLMMELFTWDAVKEGKDAGILSAMPTWKLVEGMTGDKVQVLKEMGVTDIPASRRIIDDNLTLLVQLKNNGIHVYVFHVNYDKGKDEAFVISHDMDYIYGMYADVMVE
jgi:phosphoglycerol transferase MdoB-like AlkP superfamily enzyme/glycerophosphoryl diester phosphodiesterase